MLKQFRKLLAVIGLALTALSLASSTEKPPTSSIAIRHSPFAEAILRANDAGKKRYSAGRYFEARELFLDAASVAEQPAIYGRPP